jgi:hypothetical protein
MQLRERRINSSVVNTASISGILPASGRGTVAQMAGATTDKPLGATSAQSAQATSDLAQAVEVGSSSNPFTWWIAIAALLGLLMFVSQRFGSIDEFRNIKLSIYNVVVIALASVVGLSFLKAVFTKFKIPGVSAVVLAA